MTYYQLTARHVESREFAYNALFSTPRAAAEMATRQMVDGNLQFDDDVMGRIQARHTNEKMNQMMTAQALVEAVDVYVGEWEFVVRPLAVVV